MTRIPPHTLPLPTGTTLWPGRSSRWKLRTQTLEFPRPLIMGVLNITPDSFSDGGLFVTPAAALQHARQLVEDGADLLDIGGESTRPYAEPIDLDTELSRVMPVVEAVCQDHRVPVSIDTSKSEVARQALQAGAEIINDVTGLADPAMVEVARRTGAGVCIMHMQGTPQTMQDDPRYGHVVGDVLAFLRARRDALLAAGLEFDHLCLDPGIGFGKTHQHNIDLLAGCEAFHELGCPLLVGASRKGFIGKVLGDKALPRVYGTIGVALALTQHGVQVIRVHDVAAVRQALLLFECAGGIDGLLRGVE